MKQNSSHRAVFLDRDGTVAEETGYMYDEGLLRVFPWTGPAIRRLNEHGARVILATNQSGVSRGYFTQSMVHRVHRKLDHEIGQAGGKLDAVYFCPHLPNAGCACRKPAPGLLHQAAADLALDLEQSFMIGDRYTDVRAGRAAGARTILVLTGDGGGERRLHENAGIQPDHFARDLGEAVDIILSLWTSHR